MSGPDWKTIGDNIRAARKGKGMTRAQLAEAADLSDVYIALIERGERCPTLEVLSRIADALGTDLAALLSGTAPDPAPVPLLNGYDAYEQKAVLRFLDDLRERLTR